MITFTHPLAPTVIYQGNLGASIAAYAIDHLAEFDAYVVEAADSIHGVAIELVAKQTGAPLGVVSIH